MRGRVGDGAFDGGGNVGRGLFDGEVDLCASGVFVSAAEPCCGERVDVDVECAGFGAEGEFGASRFDFGEECGDFDGADGFGDVNEAGGVGWVGVGVGEVCGGESHDGGAVVGDEFERVDGVFDERESAGGIGVFGGEEEFVVVGAGFEEVAGESEGSWGDGGVFEPAGVGGEAEVEGRGDVGWELCGVVEVEEFDGDFGDEDACGGSGGVDESCRGEVGVAAGVVVDDEGAVGSCADVFGGGVELCGGAGVEDGDGVGGGEGFVVEARRVGGEGSGGGGVVEEAVEACVPGAGEDRVCVDVGAAEGACEGEDGACGVAVGFGVGDDGDGAGGAEALGDVFGGGVGGVGGGGVGGHAVGAGSGVLVLKGAKAVPRAVQAAAMERVRAMSRFICVTSDSTESYRAWSRR